MWLSSIGDALGSVRFRIGDHMMTKDSEEYDQTVCTFKKQIWPEGVLFSETLDWSHSDIKGI